MLTPPCRLGDILVSAGIFPGELDCALGKQSVSRKKLGEVLLEEGYVQPQQIAWNNLQPKLLTSILVDLALAAMPDAEAATRSASTQVKSKARPCCPIPR